MKKELTIFIAVLLLMVAGVSATTPEEDTIVAAADRIIALQDTGGSWDWVVTNQAGPTGTTYLNIAGVTAEVLLDAYRLTGDSKYLDAAKLAGDYLINEIGDPVSPTQKQNAFSMVFLYHLADITGDTKYSDQADAMLNHVLYEENYWSNNNGNHCATDAIDGCAASELLDALKDYRSWAGDPSGIVVWDLFHFVEAAQAGGESAFATALANELDTYMSQPGFDDTIQYYDLGLSAGIIGLGKAGLGYGGYLNDLLSEQEGDGSFSNLGTESVQTTAYALMALEYAGEAAAASSASSYLVDNFGYSTYDGWLDDGDEYSEVTSEAAQAIFDVLAISNVGGIGSDFVALTVPDSIDYGTLYGIPEFESAEQTVTLENVGSLDVKVTPVWASGDEIFKYIKFSDTSGTGFMGIESGMENGVSVVTPYTTVIDAILTGNNPTTFSNPINIYSKIALGALDDLRPLKGIQTGTIYFQATET